MTVAAIHQPNFLPYLGYFNKLCRSDIFIILDNVNFSKGSRINRVQIKAGDKPLWLTVPVIHEAGIKIKDIRICSQTLWQKKHLNAFKTYYSKAPYYAEIMKLLSKVYDIKYNNLSENNLALINAVTDYMGLKRKIVFASDLVEDGSKLRGSKLLAELTVKAGGDTYLSGDGSSGYLEEDDFKAVNINLVYQNFRHPEYAQHKGEFIQGLSVIDALFNSGAQRTLNLIKGENFVKNT